MNDTLKPCPFCGGEAEIWRASGRKTSWVACMGRCATLVSKEHTTDADAIAAWNRRAALAVEGTEPVAWRFELAKSVHKETGDPINWSEPRLAFTRPCAGRMQRNVTPLYTTPPAGIREALIQLESIIHELAGDVRPGGPEDRAWAIINKARSALRGQS